MDVRPDWVMTGWREREGPGFVVCASGDLTQAEIESVYDTDSEMDFRMGPVTRLRVQTRRFELRCKMVTCYLVRGLSYADCLVRLMESTDFNPDGRSASVVEEPRDLGTGGGRALGPGKTQRVDWAEIDVEAGE